MKISIVMLFLVTLVSQAHAQSEPEIISLNNGTTIVEFHNDSSHSKKAYVCYKKMLGGNSIDVISLRESAEAQYALPITQG